MKTIQRFKIFSSLILSAILMIGCDNDGDTIYLSTPEKSDFVATQSEVKLSQETAQKVVLSLAWSKSTLAVSNPNMSAPDVMSTSVQISTLDDFSSNMVETIERSFSKAYMGAELNALAKSLNIQPNVETTIYFRLAARTGNNITPTYSNVETVKITSYLIDMSKGFILNQKKEETGRTLSAPLSNGVYNGFMGVTGWTNFYMLEGDGTIWGNDGVSGTAFLMSSENDDKKRWNFWYPRVTGCYFTEVNTIKKQWSALLLPTLAVSGDIEADMVFDRPNVKWTASFKATAASTLKIKLNTVGKQYDYSTGTGVGTEDATTKDTPVAFAQNGENISLASQAGEIAIVVPEAGDFTLIVDLSTPNAWTCKVEKGTEEPVPVIEYLYLPGIDNLISGSFTFDNYLKLYHEDELKYAGVFNVNSEWGYTINIQKDNWDDKYNMTEGDAYTGTLRYKGDNNNIPAPAAGVYLMEASLMNFSYSLTAVGNQIYVSGLHDVWNFDTPLTATATPGVYAGSIIINNPSSHGFSIYMESGNWNRKFGGAAGKLYYQGSNIIDDKTLAPGTYQMTVDIIKETYSITQ